MTAASENRGRRGSGMREGVARWLAFAALALLCYGRPAPAQEPEDQEGLVLASWNLRFLTSASRDDREIEAIAGILGRFDLVAVQEARDTRVLQRIVDQLPGWKFTASAPVGRAQKEIYAFLWKESEVSLVGEGRLIPDEADLFIREPYAATFRAGEFDFTLCTIHLLYGNNKSERRRELQLLDEVVAEVQRANGREADVILLGDFNFEPDDPGWQLTGWTHLFDAPLKTTISDSSLYDNLWLDPAHTGELGPARGVVLFDEELYGGDDDTASREISDHRPVWAVFRPDLDDDADDYGNLAGMTSVTAGGATPEIAAAPAAAVPETVPSAFEGLVRDVSDGDTLVVEVGGETVRVRLHGVDCPEKDQPYGQKAKSFTADRCLNESVRVTVVDVDRYNRSVGEVVLEDGESLNRELLREGLAWWYHQYSDDLNLGQLEIEARASRRGLWKDSNPMPPWAFRNQ